MKGNNHNSNNDTHDNHESGGPPSETTHLLGGSSNSREAIGSITAKTEAASEAKTSFSGSSSTSSASFSLSPSFWSRLLFLWFTPLLEAGYVKQFLEEDELTMLPLPVDCQTDSVMTKFEQAWEANGTISNPNHRLIRALWMAFGNEYMYAGALKLVHDLSIFVGPQVLHALIVFLKTPNAPLWHGLAWTAAVTCSQLTMSLCLRHYFFKCYATGLRVRTSIVRAVYQQALVLSATTSTSTQENGSSSSSSSSSPGSGDQQRSMGQITNLV